MISGQAARIGLGHQEMQAAVWLRAASECLHTAARRSSSAGLMPSQTEAERQRPSSSEKR